MNAGDKVRVTGPEFSAQLGKTGLVREAGEKVVVVEIEGDRPRNFKPEHLEPVKE